MNDPEYDELRAASWRGKLTPAEEMRVQAYLAARPEAQADWEEELALTRHLQELPEVPVASNFTSLVLQAIDSETTRQPTPYPVRNWWSRWLSGLAPRTALAALVLVLGVTGVQEYRSHARKQFAQGVERFVSAANLPRPEVFEDFDTIQQLQPVAFSTDDDLLAALR